MPRTPSTDPVLIARSAVARSVRNGLDPRPARRALWVAKIERLIDEALASDDAPNDQEIGRLCARLRGVAR